MDDKVVVEPPFSSQVPKPFLGFHLNRWMAFLVSDGDHPTSRTETGLPSCETRGLSYAVILIRKWNLHLVKSNS